MDAEYGPPSEEAIAWARMVLGHSECPVRQPMRALGGRMTPLAAFRLVAERRRVGLLTTPCERRPRLADNRQTLSDGALVLDSGALIALERADEFVRSLTERAVRTGTDIHVPAGVVAQVWRNGTRQARLATLLRSRGIKVAPLDLGEARAAGVLCGRSGTADIVDASVVLLARRHRAPVITSDPDDLARIDPTLTLHRC